MLFPQALQTSMYWGWLTPVHAHSLLLTCSHSHLFTHSHLLATTPAHTHSHLLTRSRLSVSLPTPSASEMSRGTLDSAAVGVFVAVSKHLKSGLSRLVQGRLPPTTV